MQREELIKKIIEKKEYSDLPLPDVERIFDLNKDLEFEEDRVKKTRAMLKKVYTVFVSNKLLNIKDKDAEWFLKKHVSTKERFEYYSQVYSKLFEKGKKYSILDLGAGINGLSYEFMDKNCLNYVGVEPVGQLVELMKNYFEKNHLKKYSALRGSLFEIEKIKELIEKTKKPRIIFLFKVLDSLEVVERNYSKKLLSEIVPLVERVVVSYATKSLISKKGFYAKRKWLKEFIEENFEIVDEFEAGIEKYFVFRK